MNEVPLYINDLCPQRWSPEMADLPHSNQTPNDYIQGYLTYKKTPPPRTLQ